MERILSKSPIRSNECPTCSARQVEVGPGVFDWPQSSYIYEAEEFDCNCAEQVNLYRHYLLAHIPEEYMRLDLSGDKDFFGDALALVDTKAYIDNWNNFKIHGLGIGYYSKTQGTGKTTLATYVGRELVKAGESVYYINFRDIISLFQVPYDSRLPIQEKIECATLLILDEVVRAISDAQHQLFASNLEELVRHRSNYNRITIMTTNLEPSELDAEYPRTFSLLAAKEKTIEVTGSDARKEIWDYNRYLAENGWRRPIL